MFVIETSTPASGRGEGSRVTLAIQESNPRGSANERSWLAASEAINELLERHGYQNCQWRRDALVMMYRHQAKLRWGQITFLAGEILDPKSTLEYITLRIL